MRCGILIPVYQPDEKLPELISRLEGEGLPVVVVDDGSTANTHIFQQLPRDAVLLRHPQNAGKGRALKTGISYLAEHGFQGVVTADADGQHSAADVGRVARAMEQYPGQLILGARKLSEMVPRSRAGNTLTRHLFRILHGINLQDTQTGLRGIPLTRDSLPGLLELPGDRYEYEMEMLLRSPRLFPAGITELPIETIYLDQNQSSHFRALTDGMKIYKILFGSLPKYTLASLCSFALDYAVFNVLYYFLFRRSIPATVLARIVSGAANFLVNRSLVFHAEGSRYTFWNYLKLAVCILLLNSGVMYLLVDLLGLPAAVMKVIVELILYLVSFTVQSNFASRRREKNV